MSDLRKTTLQSIYCPPLDPTLVAEIVNDESDINTCVDILNSLSKEATLVLENGYGESEPSSENDNDKSADESSSGENGENGGGSATNLELQMDSLSFGEGSGGGVDDDSNNNDYYYYYRDDGDLVILDDNEFDNEFEQFILSEDDYKSIDSPTGFLKECFPSIPTTRIEQLFQENGDDAETVLLCLLNESSSVELDNDNSCSDNNNDLQQTRPLPSSSSPPSSSSLASFSNSSPTASSAVASPFPTKRQRKKKKFRPKNKNKNIQTNNNNNNNNSNQNNKNKNNYRKHYPNPKSRQPQRSSKNSPWSSLSVDSSNLTPSYSNPSNTNFWNNDKIKMLQEMFPNIPPATISSKFHGNHGNFNVTLECLISPENEGFKAVKKKGNDQRSYTFRTTSNNNNYNNNYNYDDDDDDDDDDYDDDDEYNYDPGHCRHQALRFQKLRNEAFKKASEAYRKAGRGSRNGEGGITSYYSKEGQEYDQKMKAWNLKYVMSSTEQQRNGKNIIDLHGLTVDQALYAVRKHLNKLYPKGSIYGGRPLTIVTGVGNHSPNGIPKLPNAVRQVLKNDWDFVENRGHMVVKGRKK